MRKTSALVLVIAMVLVACGGDSPLAVSTTGPDGSPTTTAASTTAPPDGTTPTTSAPEDSSTAVPDGAMPGTLGSLAGNRVEDPLNGSGWHRLDWADDDRTVLASPASTTGTEGSDLLTLFVFDPAPAAGGISSDQVLVGAFLSMPTSDAPPSAVVVYTPGDDGYTATTVVSTPAIEAALLETTDYAAAAPSGEAAFEFVPSSLNTDDSVVTGWVRVMDVDGGFRLAYEGEIECDFGVDPMVCVTLTDDGVLRPGDEGEEVEGLQNDLIELGYLAGPADGEYGPPTVAAVTAFQIDYRLTVDGKAGGETRGTIEDVVGDTTNLLLASQTGVHTLSFGTEYEDAYAWIVSYLGEPDGTEDWYVDACDGHDWFKARWDGWTAVFTDRSGTRQFDGWEVNDLSDLPATLRIKGGINPGAVWEDLDAMGADFIDDFLGERWRLPALGYLNGSFVDPVTDPPAPDSDVAGFGTGTGGFESC